MEHVIIAVRVSLAIEVPGGQLVGQCCDHYTGFYFHDLCWDMCALRNNVIESLPCPHFFGLQPLLDPGHLTFKDGLAVVVGALGLARLSQLLVNATAGDVGLHVEAVALPAVQISQLYHTGLRVQLFLQTTQEENIVCTLFIHVC